MNSIDKNLLLHQEIVDDIRPLGDYSQKYVYNKYAEKWNLYFNKRREFLSLPKWKQILLNLKDKIKDML